MTKTIREAYQQMRFMDDLITQISELRQVVARLNSELQGLRFLIQVKEESE